MFCVGQFWCLKAKFSFPLRPFLKMGSLADLNSDLEVIFTWKELRVLYAAVRQNNWHKKAYFRSSNDIPRYWKTRGKRFHFPRLLWVSFIFPIEQGMEFERQACVSFVSSNRITAHPLPYLPSHSPSITSPSASPPPLTSSLTTTPHTTTHTHTRHDTHTTLLSHAGRMMGFVCRFLSFLRCKVCSSAMKLRVIDYLVCTLEHCKTRWLCHFTVKSPFVSNMIKYDSANFWFNLFGV